MPNNKLIAPSTPSEAATKKGGNMTRLIGDQTNVDITMEDLLVSPQI